MKKSGGAIFLNVLGIFASIILSIIFVIFAFALPVYYSVAGMLQPKTITTVIQNIDYVEIIKQSPEVNKVIEDIGVDSTVANDIIKSKEVGKLLDDCTEKLTEVLGDKAAKIEDLDASFLQGLVDEHIDDILNDLGYSANDFLNVDFVFIVEGKQDKNRLPLLLEKYYSDIHDENGELSRISIITTNSCTNIKTYANLKYMNQLYLRDQFLMIRDGDGKNAEELANQLCRYYSERSRQEIDKLPRVRRENVLILKYYSFENYFLNPKVMTELGIVKSEEHFWKILFSKWRKYLYKISSGRRFQEKI